MNAASAQKGQNAAELLSTAPGKILNFPLLLGLTGLMPPPIHRAHAARGNDLRAVFCLWNELVSNPVQGLFDIVILGRGTWAAARSQLVTKVMSN